MKKIPENSSAALEVGEVAILDRVDRVFHYTIPPALVNSLETGMRVLVSFRGEWKTGILIGRISNSPVSSLKPILRQLDKTPLLSPPIFEIARWLSEYYLAGWGPALRAVLPPGAEARVRKKVRLTPEGREVLQSPRKIRSETRAVMEYLLKRVGGFQPETVAHRVGSEVKGEEIPSPALFLKKRITPLIRKGWVEITREVARELNPSPKEELGVHPETASPKNNGSGKTLGRRAYLPGNFIENDDKKIKEALEKRQYFPGFVPGLKPFLWVTGLIESALGMGRNVILLVPEIGAAGTWEDQLKQKGLGPLTVLHSNLSERQRECRWQELRRGKGGIVLGTRLAVLSPVANTGLILVLDEDDPSYKQEEAPRYHARDLAVLRAVREDAVVLLSGACPSLETYSNIQSGKYHHLHAVNSLDIFRAPRPRGKVEHRPVPPPRIISLEGTSGKGPLTEELKKEISKTFEQKNPVVLILNRKGFGMALFCRDCGFVLRCPRCEVAATFSRKEKRSSCPYCGWGRPSPSSCDQCHGTRLAPLGFGTERAEEYLSKQFPDARIGRVEEGHGRLPASGKAIEKLNRRELDMVIGTQAILNGPSLDRNGLVALLEADGAFHHPDFRAGEKTFRLISRLLSFSAGSEVVIQTFYPGHESISWAANGNPETFYKYEISQRKALSYPPFSRLAVVTVKSLNHDKARHTAQRLLEILAEKSPGSGVQILGPAPSLRPRLFQKYRWQILIKAPDSQCLHRLLSEGLGTLRAGRGLLGVWFEVDVDPVKVG